MGVKRKASALEETPVQHPSSPPSLVSASTQSSPSSLCTEPYHQPLHDTQWTNRNDSAPWLNLRTRKRTRDNRPSEAQVHSQTIQKLFKGQKHIDENPQLPLPPEEEAAGMDLDTDMLENDEGFEVTLEPEPNQRSLHDFFGGHPSNAAKQQNMHDFFDRPYSAYHPNPMHAATQGSTLQSALQTTPGLHDILTEPHQYDFSECRRQP